MRQLVVGFLLPVLVVMEAYGASLRFFGNGIDDIDRVKILVDNPSDTLPGPPADIGAEDFTIEFWLKGSLAENPAPAVACGENINWIYGHVIIDRDRYLQDRKFGISVAGGYIVFGVSGDGTGDMTLCSAVPVLDGSWHHVAVQRERATGIMSMYVDGVFQGQVVGPGGDISYPDDGIPGNYCGGPCVNSDPYLVFGAEKHDAGSLFPSFSGWLTNVRLSRVIRYTQNFTPASAPFSPDADTVALYLFDEGTGLTLNDSSGFPGGPSDGVIRFGGNPPGPVWSAESPFQEPAPVEVYITGPRQVEMGSEATLRVEYSGLLSIPTIAWSRDGVEIPGAFDETLVLLNIDEEDAGAYVATLTTADKAVYQSPPFILTVVPMIPAAGTLSLLLLAVGCVLVGGLVVNNKA
ncbi:MAG: hypothetical protein KBH78_12045 [Candidatus Hydrogenedentes bacterium]|nr:hypothetical protein [Candidatus Hydrogenedentota bacterium]